MRNMPTDIQASFTATALPVDPPRPKPAKRISTQVASGVNSCERCGKVKVSEYVQVSCEGKRCYPAWIRKTPEEPWWNIQDWIVQASKVLSYLGWLSSAPVDDATESRRNHACVEMCQFAIKREGHVWCPFCACPQVPGADVRVKNRRAGHNCPIGMHAGSVPEPRAFAAARKAYGLSLVNPKRKKCGGCGG